MKVDQNNYKFYRSFRIKTEDSDKVFIIIKKIYLGEVENYTNSKSQVLDFNSQGLSFNSDVKIPLNSEIEFHFKCEKFLCKFSKVFKGQVIRSFVSDKYSKEYNYAVKLEKSDDELNHFISKFIDKFSKDRLTRYFKESCFNTRSADLSEAKEVFSLVISIFKNFLINEEGKKSKNEIDFIKIQKQLNLENISLTLLDENDTFVTKHTGKDINKVYSLFDYSKLRLSTFSTNKVVSHHLVNEDKSVYYIAAPVVNKFNNPVGILEYIKCEQEGQFSFEDEKVIQLMAYILSAQLKNHRPVIASSHFEHMNPRKIPVGFLNGISSARNKVIEIVKSLLMTNISSLLVGDEGDRDFIVDYICEKFAVFSKIETIKIADIATTHFEEECCYIIDLSQASAMHLNTMAYTIEKLSKVKFILHTGYHNWLTHIDEYYKLNILNSLLPPFVDRTEDFLEIAEHICDMNCIPFKDDVKKVIQDKIPLKYVNSYSSFKSLVTDNFNTDNKKDKFLMKDLADGLFNIHDANLKLEEYSQIVDTLTQSFDHFTLDTQELKSKKAA